MEQMTARFTRAELAAMQSKLAQTLENQASTVSNSRRNIIVGFRGFTLPLTVSSAKQELDIRVFAKLKESVDEDDIPELPFEHGLPRLSYGSRGHCDPSKMSLVGKSLALGGRSGAEFDHFLCG